jgi:hypothetical protein
VCVCVAPLHSTCLHNYFEQLFDLLRCVQRLRRRIAMEERSLTDQPHWYCEPSLLLPSLPVMSTSILPFTFILVFVFIFIFRPLGGIQQAVNYYYLNSLCYLLAYFLHCSLFHTHTHTHTHSLKHTHHTHSHTHTGFTVRMRLACQERAEEGKRE